jgi:alkylhydroperoxidase family enzyme
MVWVPWIETENEHSSSEEIKKLYNKTRNPLSGKISDLTRITSLTPEVSEHLNTLGSAVYRNATGFTAREKEIIALVTSSFIGCVH